MFSSRTGEPRKPIALKEFKTDLEIAEGQWSQVRVGYNLEELIFIVNRKIRRFPFSERGAFFKPSVFGGHIQPENLFGKGATFFKGQLRSLRIVHGTYQSDFSEKLNH